MRWKDMNKGYADRVTEMAAKSPHEILGVRPDAPSAEVRAAYIRMIKAYHPDRSDFFMARYNQEVLKLVNVAYEKMKDRS
jgi:DnaJ-class molecular chaperone